MFDTDKGYTGTISYALGLVDINRADKSTSNGLESDNDQSSSPVNPITHPVYNNITIIGLPTAAAASSTNRPPSGTGRYGNAATLRKRAQFDINRSVFMGFNCGIFLEETNPGPSTYSYYVDGISTLNNNFVHGFVNAFCKNSGGFTPIETTNIGYVGPDPNAGIKLNAPFLRNNFSNFAPATGSPVQTAGAFPLGNTAWANGWARL